jgi:hypothetical protein
VRAVALLVVAALLVVPLPLVWSRLHFVPSALSNRITDYALAWLLLLGFLAGLTMAWRATVWLLAVLKPGRLGFWILEDRLEARLATFGRWSCAWEALVIDWPDYLFSLELDKEDPLPMKECPPMRTPDGVAVDVLIRRFAGMSEDLWWPRLETNLRPRLFHDERWEE